MRHGALPGGSPSSSTAVQCHAAQRHAAQRNAMPRSAMPRGAMPCGARGPPSASGLKCAARRVEAAGTGMPSSSSSGTITTSRSRPAATEACRSGGRTCACARSRPGPAAFCGVRCTVGGAACIAWLHSLWHRCCFMSPDKATARNRAHDGVAVGDHRRWDCRRCLLPVVGGVGRRWADRSGERWLCDGVSAMSTRIGSR